MAASRIRATAPNNLRVRMVMTEMCGIWFESATCARVGAHYKGRANPFKVSKTVALDDRHTGKTDLSVARRPRVARRGSRPDRADGAGRRRHAPHRIRALDHGMEAGHRRAAAARTGTVGTGLRGLQADPAIPRTQRRHDAVAVQDHLLVGVEPPAARPRDRHGLPPAVPVLPVARRIERGTEAAAMADLRPRRVAGGGRLVDGGVRAVEADRGFAISSCDASGAGAFDLRSHRLDAAAAWRARAFGRAGAAEDRKWRAGRTDLRATLFRRTGRGAARRPRLQHLARDRRRIYPGKQPPLVRYAMVAQSF